MNSRTIPLRSPRQCSRDGCEEKHRALGLCRRHYDQEPHRRASKVGNPSLRKARDRAKTHRRRAVERYSDVTSIHERELRTKATRCPLCLAKMIDAPYLPPSKELDHIIPLNVGGTHTIGNVRIICRACNLKRPRDGSDYTGPVTLWAQDPAIALPRPPRGICQCGTRKVNGRCYGCQPRKSTRTRQADGERAAELRAEGWRWADIAQELGFYASSNAGAMARKYGKPEMLQRWPEDEPQCRSCGVELPRGGVGRPRSYCAGCGQLSRAE